MKKEIFLNKIEKPTCSPLYSSTSLIGLNNAVASTFKNLAIAYNVSIDGCLKFLHQVDTPPGLTPSAFGAITSILKSPLFPGNPYYITAIRV